MNFYFILTVLLISGIIYTQDFNTPDQQNREALKSIRIIESIMSSLDTTYSATFETNSAEKIDSICYSHKTQFDLSLEKNDRKWKINQLGNRLEYYEHYLGNFKVRYVIFDNNLWKIKFNFSFSHVYTEDTSYFYKPTKEILDSVKSSTSLPIEFEHSGYKNEITGFSYSFVFPRMDYELRRYSKGKLEPYIEVKNIDIEFQKHVDYVNDPINSLTYGFVCGPGGASPDGLWEFAKIVHFKKIYLAEKLLFSPNPVARLMAHDAVEFYMRNNFYIPQIKYLKQLKIIENDETIIHSCWGCIPENITMKDAVDKATESKKHLYHNIIFPKKRN